LFGSTVVGDRVVATVGVVQQNFEPAAKPASELISTS
jgi:hypothetical protein